VPADNAGNIVIPVTVTDGKGGVTVVNVTLQPVNPAPTAVREQTPTTYLTPVIVDFLANDSDRDGDPLSIVGTPTANPAQGSLARDPLTGAWTFTPASGFAGTATIAYTITDQDGATSSSTHDVVVTAPTKPVAINDYYSTGYLQPMTGDVRTGDTFVAGSSISVLSQPTNGTLSFNPNGTYMYTPVAGFAGTETFVYQITDPVGQTALAIEVIRVTPPVILAVSDGYTTPYNAALNGNAGANDTFAVGSTFIAITAPMNGTLAMNADGSYVYTPRAGYVGTDMFAYAVTDPLGQTRFATDTITVSPPPAPVAVSDTFSAGYMAPVTGNAATGDTSLSGATFSAASQPTHGTLVFNSDGTYTYTPAAGYAGTDTFTYRVTDPTGLSSTATETITVAAPALAAVDDAFTGVYGTPVSGNAANGDTFATGSTFAMATSPSHGNVTMNASGAYAYTPAAGFAGTDAFTYRVTDPTGQTMIATETIVITPPALIAVDDTFTTAFNTPVNGNAALGDTFAPGSTFAVSTPPAAGSVTMNANGTYTFTPPTTVSGTVTFSYQVTDPTGQVRSAVETVVVSQPRLIAVSDAYSTPFNTTLNGNAAAGDTYAPGSMFTVLSSPLHGSVSMSANGSYQYIPAATYSGIDTFTYSITDPTGRTATATETITVAPRPAVHQCLTTFGVLRRR
jgi:large repetitive protein